MKKMIKLAVLLGAAAPLVVWGASTEPAGPTNAGAAKPPVNSSNLFTNEIIAKGKGVSITRNELDEEVVRIKAGAAAQGRMLPPDLEPQVLDAFITRQLLLAKATEAEKAKGREQFHATLQKYKTDQKLSDEEFNQKLGAQLRLTGLTRDEWEKQNVEKTVFPIVLERELKVDITDDQAKKYYDETPATFEQPERVRAAHVLIGTRDSATGAPLSEEQKTAKKKQAEDILKRARAGEDFAKLAKEYSEDPGSKDSGGEYTFPRGQMTPEFEAAAFSLNTNQVSDIVTTTFGYHIIKLYEKMPAKKEPFAGADTKTIIRKPDGQYATLREILTDQSIKKQFPDFLQKLKKDAGVQILDEKLKLAETPMPASGAGAGQDSPAAPAKKP